MLRKTGVLGIRKSAQSHRFGATPAHIEGTQMNFTSRERGPPNIAVLRAPRSTGKGVAEPTYIFSIDES